MCKLSKQCQTPILFKLLLQCGDMGDCDKICKSAHSTDCTSHFDESAMDMDKKETENEGNQGEGD